MGLHGLSHLQPCRLLPLHVHVWTPLGAVLKQLRHRLGRVASAGDRENLVARAWDRDGFGVQFQGKESSKVSVVAVGTRNDVDHEPSEREARFGP